MGGIKWGFLRVVAGMETFRFPKLSPMFPPTRYTSTSRAFSCFCDVPEGYTMVITRLSPFLAPYARARNFKLSNNIRLRCRF